MKFKITTSGWFYMDEDAEKLKKLGFAFERTESTYMSKRGRPWGKSYDAKIYREFTTLEELMAFVREWGECVLTEDTVEIYDYYRE